MEQELQRGQAELAKQDPAPYFTRYAVSDDESLFVIASEGGLLSSNRVHRRTADVSMRIGSPALDNTHDVDRRSGLTSGQLPLRDDPDAIARVLWKLTYEEYRQAQQAYSNVKTKSAVRAKDEDDSADFSEEKPSTYLQETTWPHCRKKRCGKNGAAVIPDCSVPIRTFSNRARSSSPRDRAATRFRPKAPKS